jgi:hypothetical protein
MLIRGWAAPGENSMAADVLDWIAPFSARAADLRRVVGSGQVGRAVPDPVTPHLKGVAHGGPLSQLNLKQRIARTRHLLRKTMARTALPINLRPRMEAFDRALASAARLAAAADQGCATSATALPQPGPTAVATNCSVRDLIDLAYSSLDAGVRPDAFVLLAGLGALLGGTPRAAFEVALGLLRVGQAREACEFLQEAAEGMTDTDGFVHGLLAQLWQQAGDQRWVAAARHVLATGRDLDARNRCLELLRAARLT